MHTGPLAALPAWGATGVFVYFILMKDYLEYIVKSLVDAPDEVQITEVQGEFGPVLEVKVAREDLGKVIGKQGRTVKAIRSILGAASIRANRRVMLEILE